MQRWAAMEELRVASASTSLSGSCQPRDTKNLGRADKGISVGKIEGFAKENQNNRE